MIKRKWKVEWTDKEEGYQPRVAPFDSKLEALRWIKKQIDHNMIDPLDFDVIKGPYEDNSASSSDAQSIGKINLWFDAVRPAPEGFKQMKSVEDFIDDLFVSIGKDFSKIGIISLDTANDQNGHSFKDILNRAENGNAKDLKVHVHGSNVQKKNEMLSQAKENGWEIIEDIFEDESTTKCEDEKMNEDEIADKDISTDSNSSTYKLWIDDIRPAPNGYVWLKSVNDFIDFMVEHGIYGIEVFDFDHDAGDYAKDGGDYIKCLDWLESVGADNINVRIHSSNPIGIKKMRQIIQKNQWNEVFDIIDEMDIADECFDGGSYDDLAKDDDSLEMIDEKDDELNEQEDHDKKQKVIDALKKASKDFQKLATNNNPNKFADIVVAFDDLIGGVGSYDFKKKKTIKEDDKEQFLCEDKEGKNINRAEKWIKDNHPEVIGRKLENGTTITPRILTQEIRNTVPNVRMADCKFLVGATRMYFDLQNDVHEFQSKMNKLNKMLKIICIAHLDEYDNNFNNLSFDELDKKFSGAVKKELDDDREQIDKLQLIKNTSYKIVPIDSFDEAQKYGNYTSWCVTHYPDMYSNYTKGGLGRFYFCLQDGFENVPKIKSEGCPMDAYGKSMIAISVNDDGSLNTCTCRWNHDNGGNDNMMDTKEISKFFGVDFYKTFRPYDTDELWKKIIKKQVPLRRLLNDDVEFCKTFDCIAIYADDEDDNDDEDNFDSSIEFKKLIDGKITTLPFIDKTTTYINNKFVTMKNGKFAITAPKTIKNIPKNIKGNFVIPNGVTSIGNSTFRYCSGLTNVTIPNSVMRIGESAFENCSGLTSVTIPDSVTSIGSWAFYGCSASLFDTTTIPGVMLVDGWAVGNTGSLSGDLNLTGIRGIGDWAFSDCSGLMSVTIPASVTSIGEGAFSYCNKLKSMIFKGKSLAQVKSMKNYPFGIEDESIIKCENQNK